MMIEVQKNKEKYCISNGKSPLEQIPNELKDHFLYYEISNYTSVTISSGLIINYYFKLNEETKNYLLQFRNDFCLTKLQDLTLYKDDEKKFYSCTHDRYNSIKLDYKNMSNDEIIDFINDEFYEENNDKVIEIVNKLIAMKKGTKFSFEEINVSTKLLIDKICILCDKLNLKLISSEYQLPTTICNIDDLIEKQR